MRVKNKEVIELHVSQFFVALLYNVQFVVVAAIKDLLI